jgi:hypothetical protein
MTERKYQTGIWYPHDGGPCPVPGKSRVRIMGNSGHKTKDGAAVIWDWPDVIAFCVTEYPDEEETQTGTCNAFLSYFGYPFLSGHREKDTTGTYTLTTVNGKPKRIVWEADQ